VKRFAKGAITIGEGAVEIEAFDMLGNEKVYRVSELDLERIIKGVLDNKELVQAIKDYERDRRKDLIAAPGSPPYTGQIKRICEFLGPAAWTYFRTEIVSEIQRTVLK